MARKQHIIELLNFFVHCMARHNFALQFTFKVVSFITSHTRDIYRVHWGATIMEYHERMQCVLRSRLRDFFMSLV